MFVESKTRRKKKRFSSPSSSPTEASAEVEKKESSSNSLPSEARYMKNKGFTLVELMVVVSIIGLLSIVVFANYRAGERQFALQRSAHKLTQDVRRAQNMAMATREIGEVVPEGYGIYLDTTSPTQYILFADLNGDGLYDDGDTKVETLEFEKRVGIIGLSLGNSLSVVFFPPDPSVLISGNPAINSASVTLNFEGGSGKTIKVNKAGLIEIE